ncbi:MmcQ/YjbR family DNA-binding protein [Psychrobium sp. 1_MG-2023]|uniref:MmcQ/YjbR family DNA-binding protein n=1 Tax=Psychrobium sp. 1_MG-2023 TaxID=3062624 RepID=UPI000C3325E3|nr:MmcQ/YjbR family DNA-binding protein [Psychrobium sp. 1_MG-2023]MDP2561247.1 MmcQ/YjbR family DNA-binding protein [Psychrobium sp. 1_MG-2023]PKF55251.1 MmcQ-like protein [Alteromonadales bacterium alter-6D02]
MEIYINYIMAKHFCLLDYPFGRELKVFKVKGKIFAIVAEGNENQRPNICLKCTPESAIELRKQYQAIVANSQYNEKHWNTVFMDDSISDQQIKTMIDTSYDLVVAGLPKKVKRLMK